MRSSGERSVTGWARILKVNEESGARTGAWDWLGKDIEVSSRWEGTEIG